MKVRIYTQERECKLERCLGEGCPTKNIGCLGEAVDLMFNIFDNSSHQVFHYNGNTIVVKNKKEKAEEIEEIPSGEGKPPVRKKRFSHNSCVTQVMVCGATEDEVIEGIINLAKTEHFPSLEKAKQVMEDEARRGFEIQIEHVKKFPHVYSNPQQKLVELEAKFVAQLSEIEGTCNSLDYACKIVNESLE
jgi:hypothetical protein